MEKFYKNGYCVKSYMSQIGLTNPQWKEYVLNGMPFIKKKAFQDCDTYKNIEGWKDFVKENTTYPMELMESALGNIDSIVKKKQLKSRLKKLRRNLLRVNIKKDKIKINILGIPLVNIEKVRQRHTTEQCPIYNIKQQVSK